MTIFGSEKFKEKCEGNKIKRKSRGKKKTKEIKNKFKVNKLFLYITLNFFHRFNSFIYGLNNLKIITFLKIF